jgi:hypothetical protein
MFQKQANRSLFWGLLAVGAFSCIPAAMAQETGSSAPLHQPSPFEAIDQVAKTNTFWTETTLLKDAKDVFFIGSDEYRIQKRSQNFETVYLDLMKQQGESHVIIRTQDIANTYDTSLFELQK